MRLKARTLEDIERRTDAGTGHDTVAGSSKRCSTGNQAAREDLITDPRRALEQVPAPPTAAITVASWLFVRKRPGH